MNEGILSPLCLDHYDIFTKRMIDYRRRPLVNIRRSRTRAIKIISINKPDPVLAAQLALPLLLAFLTNRRKLCTHACTHSKD